MSIDPDPKELVSISKLYLIQAYLETSSNDEIESLIDSNSQTIFKKLALIFKASFENDETQLKEAFDL